MSRSFNYSKWDNIELSDDEGDLHPNIDKDSWFRMKHRTRLEREQKEDMELAEYDKLTKEDNIRIRVLRTRIERIGKGGDEDDDMDDVDALQGEIDELLGRIAAREKRKAEVMDRRAWNIDNICKTKEEKSVITTNAGSRPLVADEAPDSEAEAESEEVTAEPAAAIPTASTADKVKETAATPKPTAAAVSRPAEPAKSSPAHAPKSQQTAAITTRERFAAVNYNDFAIKHEDVLENYSEIRSLEDTKDFLFKHCDTLLHEHAQSYMLLSSLEDEMNGKHDRMKLVCRQSQILTHIQELGVSMKRDPRDVILPFFHRIAQPEYLKGFLGAVEDFRLRIVQRAAEKRAEMDREQNEGTRRVGPGGLDPLEVLEQLPQALQVAFESQDVGRLQDVLAAMEPKDAKRYMKLCVDSGLWVPQDESIFENEADFPPDEDE